MKSFFNDKFNYNHLSNQKIIQLIENTPESYSEKAQILIGHTLNAHHIWNKRLIGEKPMYGVWELFEISVLQKINAENLKESLQIIQDFNLKQDINYTNSSGNSFNNRVENILFHIINHSTYHRGQLISELKLKGIAPISTDFIFYKP